MLADISRASHIYIVCGYTDMRKSIDGLCAVIQDQLQMNPSGSSLFLFCGRCNLRRASATDALTSGRLAEQNGRPPDNPNSVLQLDHHDIMLGDPLEDCVSRYCIVHDHGLPFVWFPLGTDDRAP